MKNVTKTNVLFTSTVLVYLIMIYAIRLIPAGTFSLNMLLIMPEIILLIPSIAYITLLRPDNIGSYGVEKVSPLTGLLTVVFTICVIPLMSLINMISSLFVENSVDETLIVTVNNNSMVINIILLALIPAVVEEFIFRGLIFNGYKKRNPFKAALLSAALFGLVHMNFNQFSYAFVMGILFALLTYATGSIVPSIIAHTVVNGTSVVLSHVLADMDTTSATNAALETMTFEQLEMMIYLIFAVMAVIGLVIAYFVFRFICKKNRGFENVKNIFKKPVINNYDEEQGRFFDGYLLLGIAICVAYIIIYDFVA